MTKRVIAILFLIWVPINLVGQNSTIVYKTVNDTIDLRLKVIKPTTSRLQKSACGIYLSGGGWSSFSWNQFDQIAYGLSDQGLTSIIVEYRTKNTHNSTPFDSLEDVKDAIVFIRKNADSLNIRKNQIISIGSSAGGHLAFSSYLYQDTQEKEMINTKPNYIIGISPVLRNDESGYAYEIIGEKYKTFSPYYLYLHTDKRLPPSLIVSGENDNLIDFIDLKTFYKKSAQKNDKMELYCIKKTGHSIIKKHPSFYTQVYPIITAFLRKNNIALDSLIYPIKNK